MTMSRRAPRPSRASILASLVLVLAFCAPAARAADVHWTATASGLWTDGANWSGGIPPAAGDNVFIVAAGTYVVTLSTSQSIGALTVGNATGAQKLKVSGGTLTVSGGISGVGEVEVSDGATLVASGGTWTGTAARLLSGTLQIDVPASIGALTLSGGTMTGNGAVTVNGDFSWTGGTMTGNGTTTISGAGTCLISGDTYRSFSRSMLTLSRNTTFTATNMQGDGGSLVVASGYTLDVQSDAGWYGGGLTALDVAGTLLRSTSAGLATIDWPIIGTGLINVTSGTLRLTTGTTHASIDVGPAGTFEINAGTHGAASISGTGTVAVTGGALTVAAGATWTHTGPVRLSHGTLQIDVPASIGALTLLGGTLTGSASLTLNGEFVWSAGTMSGTGTTIIAAGAASSLITSATVHTLGRTLELLRNTVIDSSNLYSSGSGVLDVASGVTLDLQSDVLFSISTGPGSILLAGSLQRTASSGQATIDWPVNGGGTVSVISGSLWLRGGGTYLGAMSVGPGAALGFQGTTSIDPPATISGAGTVLLAGGTTTVAVPYDVTGTTSVSGIVEFNAASSTSRLNLLSGQLGGTHDLTVNGEFVWSAGTMTGTGTTIIAAGAASSLITSATIHTLGRTLELLRNTVIDSSNLYSSGTGVLEVASGVTLDLQSDVFFSTFSGPGSILLAGTLQRTTSSGQATIGWSVTSSGTIRPRTGTLAFSGGLTHTGTIEFPLASSTSFGNMAVSGSLVLGGTLTAYPVAPYVPVDGTQHTVLTYGSVSGSFSTRNLTYTGGRFADVVGPGSLVLTATNGTATLTAVAPASGSSAGGTAVTLTGTGFTTGSTVSFGGTPATGLTVGSAGSLTCLTPAHAAGTVDVTVTTLDGLSGTLGAGFTFTGEGVDVGVTQTNMIPYAATGGWMQFQVTVTNHGAGPASNVVLTSTAPPGTTSPITEPACTVDGSTITCAIGSLASGASVSYYIAFHSPTTPGSVAHTVSVTATESDPVPSNNSSTAVTTVALPRTFVVDSTADTPDASPGDGVCADTTAACTLRAAIQESNYLEGHDIIQVPPGSYLRTEAGSSENNGATGDLDVWDSLDIVGTGTVTIDAAGLDRVLDILGRDYGGAIHAIIPTVTLTDLTLRGGSAPGEQGGGIWAVAHLVLTRVAVTNNSADAGGGIFGSWLQLTCIDSRIQDNAATGYGGGLYLDSGGPDTITKSTIGDNTAENGGGLYVGSSYLTLLESTVSGNTATLDGGGIKNGGGTVSVITSTVSGNSAGNQGGGILHWTTFPTTVSHSTIANNAATGGGGGIYNAGSNFTLLNTIVSDSPSGSNCAGAALTSGGTNISSDATCFGVGGTDRSSLAPMLGPLQNNGGPTFTHALLTGSPAIDTGAGCSGTDQRGIARPRDGDGNETIVCDVGAYELELGSGPDLAISITDGVTLVNPGQALTYTIVVTNNSAQTVANAPVTDTLPASLSGAIWSCTATPGSSCVVPGGTGNVAVDLNLAASGTATISLTATLSAGAAGSLTNTATIALPAGLTDPVPSNNIATDVDTINPASPTIVGFSPASGPAGTSVVLTGANFNGASAVRFNGVDASSFTVDSPTQITATAPGPVGAGPITVVVGAATATSGTNFATTGSSITVTNTNDSGFGSLRQALLDAQAGLCIAPCAIGFNIPGPGVRTITAASDLTVGSSISIDGTTQPGYAGTPIIEIDGGGPSACLTIFGNNNTIRGLAINRCNALGVAVVAGDANTIAGCYLGVHPDGTTGAPNTYQSLTLTNGASGNVIGGQTAADRNLIFAKASMPAVTLDGATTTGNTIIGNYIGVNATGDAAVTGGGAPGGVTVGGIAIFGAASTTIGGTAPGQRNVISGMSSGRAIHLSSDATGVTIVGNYIGTNAAGTAALPNEFGVFSASAGVTIGGSAPGAGNLISGNTYGVYVSAGPALIRGNVIGYAADGVTPLPNTTFGVQLNTSHNKVGGTVPGAGNKIGNSVIGVNVYPFTSIGNEILGNRIAANSGIGIDLNYDGATANDAGDVDAGANGLQNYPAITSATRAAGNLAIRFSLNANVATTASVRIETFKADGSALPQGAQLLSSTCFGGVSSLSDTTISVAAPPVVAGDRIVATATNYSDASCITVSEGTSEFSPAVTISGATVTGFTPTSGRAGTVVTISGTGFTAVTAVAFGAWPAPSFTIISDTTIEATVPADTSSGAITVIITGSVYASSATPFTFIPDPSITSFTPTSGGPGTVVTISGAGFTGATGVTFGDVASSTFSVDSDSQVRATVPGGGASGPVAIQFPAMSTTSTTFFCSSGSVEITAPATACATQTYAASTWAVGPNVGVTPSWTWTITNGTITGGGGTRSILFVPDGGGPVQLGVTLTLGTCSLSNSVTIPVGGGPAVTITVPPYVCSVGTGTASVADVPGQTYNWTVVNGTIGSGQGTAAITFTAASTGVLMDVSVQVTAGGCNSIAAASVPIVNPTITAPASVCINSIAHHASVPPYDGATYSWSVGYGTITGGQNTNNITFDAGSHPYVWLTVNVTTSCGTISREFGVATDPPTWMVYSGDLVCPGSTGNVVSVTNLPGTTYVWTVDGGTITDGQGTNQITYAAGPAGSGSVSISSTNGCGTNTSTMPITIGPPVISAPDHICGPGPFSAHVPIAGNATYQWVINGGTATTPTNGWYVQFVPSGSAPVQLAVTIGNLPCGPLNATKTVAVDGMPTTPLLTAPASVCAGSIANTASVASIAGTTWLWSISGGTITSGQGTESIVFSAASGGNAVLTVQGTNSCGATPTASRTIPISGTSAPVASNSGPACAGGSLTLTASATVGATYAWTGPNGFTSTAQNPVLTNVTLAQSGTYTVIATVNGCVSPPASTTVTINPAPVVTITGPTSICAGTTATLDAGAGFTTYSWSNGAASQQITVSPTTDATYTVTVTTADGCTAMASKTLIVNAVAPATITPGGPTTFCAGGNVTLTASTGATHQWYEGATAISGATAQALTVTTSGNYSVEVTLGNGCVARSAPTAVAVTTPPAAPTVASNSPVCEGGSLNLTATPSTAIAGATYSWTGPNGFTSAEQNPVIPKVTAATHAGTYTVVMTANGCPAPPASTTVAIGPGLAPVITAPGSVCAASTDNVASIPAVAGATYAWTVTGGTITGGAGSNVITFTAGATGPVSIAVTVTSGNCSGTATASVGIAPPPPITIAGPETVCPDAPFSLEAPAGYASYSWSNGATTRTILVRQSVATDYRVTVTAANGCVSSGEKTVGISAVPAVAIQAPSFTCAGATTNVASVAPQPGATYLWTIANGRIVSGAETSSIVFETPTPGDATLDVTVSVGACAGSGTVTIAVTSTPPLTVSGPDAVCPGGSATLTAADGYTGYTWATGETTQSITVSPAVATRYSVTARTVEGCEARGEKVVGVSASPTVTITAPARACAGSSGGASVAPQAGATYQWTISGGTITAGGSSPSITFTPDAAGQVTLGVTIVGSGCTSSGSITIPIAASPEATITGPDSICTGGSVTLDAGAGFATYRWSTGETTRTITKTPAATATYTVTVTTSDGCPGIATRTVAVTVPANAAITAATSVTPASTGNRASVPAQPNAVYVWGIVNGSITSGLGTNTILFTAGTSGTVTITADVNAGGCTASGRADIAIQEVNANLTITKSGPATVQTGAAFNYTLAIGNAGPAAATSATVTDELPAGVTFQSATVTGGWTCSSTGVTVVCLRATIAKDDTSTITLAVRAPEQAGILTNRATIRSLSPDPDMTSNVSTVTTTVEAPPPVCSTTAPTLVSPADGATGVTAPVALQWNAANGASGYEVWLATGGGSAVMVATTTTATSATVSVASGTTSWYVIARLSGNCPPLRSLTRTFTVPAVDTCAQNPRPELTAPAAGATTPESVTFGWTPAAGAVGYRVIASVAGAAAQDVGTTTATTLTARLTPGTATATVEALFSGCPATVSNGVTFTVAAPDSCANRALPALTAPADGATLTTASVQFSWLAVENATEYRVMILEEEPGEEEDPEEIGRTSGTTLSVNLEHGTAKWWVEALFNGCASTVSAQRTFTIPPAHVCPTSAPTLLAPANGITSTNPSVTYQWSPTSGAVGYELWASYAGGAPTLLTSADARTLSVVRNATSGATEWFVRTLYDRCPSIDSEHRTFIYEPSPDCSGARAPTLLTPIDGEAPTSPVSFRWTPVAGATRYELYMSSSGSGEPTLMYSDANVPSSAIAVPIGAYSWFVRAEFGPCGDLRSTQSRVKVIAPPPACQPLGIPSISAPAEISSGIRFAIRWSEVPGATSYGVQVATESQFGRPVNASVEAGTGNSYEIQEVNGDTVPKPIYVRVRAIDTRCNPPQNGLYSTPAVIFILPEVTSDATIPASDARTLTYQLPLGPDLAGRSFTATPTQSWLSVTPTSGVVPQGGMFLTVTAAVVDLPQGTSLGGITITLTEAFAGNVAGQGTTTYTTPVSVNIVSPATSTAKTSPPPDALIIPAVAHATGINAQFQSDVRVTNTSAETMKYQLSFVPSGEAGMSAGMQATMDVDPGATVALDDVLKTWFSSGTQSTTGTLEIRPLTQARVTPAPAGTLANLLTFASSRTFNATANGTYGQFIPAIPFARFVGRTGLGGPDSVISLQQIAQSDRYRTNLGLVEGSGEPASLLVTVFGKGSAKLLEFPVQLKGGQHLQLNSVLAQHGLSTDDGRIEVKVLSSVGKVTAYASVLDNQTNDPLLVSPHTVSQAGLTSWVVPGIADLANGLANWKTDVRLYNNGTTPVTASVRFYSQRGGEPQIATLSLQPGETRVLDSVLTTLFNAPGDGGALHVLTQTPARLVATARTYNQSSAGTYGQFIPAVTQAEAAAVGSRPLQILQVEQSERFRTNVGLAEVSGKPVEVEISAIIPGSKVSPILRAKLAPNEFRQLNSLLTSMGLGETYNARVTVRAVDGTGRVAAYGSVIDARTQDPTYIPAQ